MARKYQVRLHYNPECGCCSEGYDLDELFDTIYDAEKAGDLEMEGYNPDYYHYSVTPVEIVDNSNKPSRR